MSSAPSVHTISFADHLSVDIVQLEVILIIHSQVLVSFGAILCKSYSGGSSIGGNIL